MNFEDEYTPEQILQELRATFREEGYELIADLESALLELEKKPDDKELIGSVFRSLHTIKGSSNACEFHDITEFAHELETFFDQVRSGRVDASKEIIDLILGARDQIRAMFDRYYKDGSADESARRALLNSLYERVPVSNSLTGQISPIPLVPEAAASATYRIRFRPSADVFRQGTDPLRLLGELRSIGTCNVVAQTEDIPALENMDAQACYTCWDMILTTNRGKDAIEDVFIFMKEGGELQIEIIDTEGFSDSDATHKKIGEILLERGDVTNEDLQKVLRAKKRVGEMLVETGVVTPEKVASALAEQQHVLDIRKVRKIADESSSIRVQSRKLDTLVNLVGELVTVQARLTQAAGLEKTPLIVSVAEDVERLVTELRDNAMSIRMLPIGTIFGKFKRLVRDLSRNLGKEIELKTGGDETELDKSVIERLHDPLVHLIRNSIDHGIELPDSRVAAGKPRKGVIHLEAVHSGANVVINISDDGSGIDTEAVRRKAMEKGLIPDHAAVPKRELFALLFEPGFSTTQKVTSVSGRGVGLDVVKKTIEALRGSVEVCSVKGKGTTMALRLPLTLAIIDGFLTRVANEHFILPLAIVEECVELNAAKKTAENNRNMVNVRGHLVPYIRLREQFRIAGDPPAIEQIVIGRVNEHRIGFAVDAVIGSHQTVIKNLSRLYKNVEEISGATILGDGTVALILDAQKLVGRLEHQERQTLIAGNS